MKVDVITRHAVGNYGSILQTYATQKVFEKLGYECEIIDYQRIDEKGNISWKTLLNNSTKWNKNFFTRLTYRIIQKPNCYLQYKKFSKYQEQLLKKTIEYNTNEELRKNLPSADVFCVGSDQVWGKIANQECDSTYFLDFVPKQYKCISYSASIGKENVPQEIINNIKTNLPRFSSILVREQSAVDIIKNEGIDNVDLVLDPTLLLSKDEWSNLCNDIPRRKKKYILVYQLHDNKDFQKYVKKFSKKAKLPIIRICPSVQNIFRGGKPVFLPTPQEFISYFRDAEYVITDSFHGTVFSIIYNKKIIDIVPGTTGTRITNILELLGLNDRILNSYDDYTFLNKERSYEEVNKLLENKKIESIKKLNDAISK